MRKRVISSMLLLAVQFLVGPSALSVVSQEPDGKILTSKPWPSLPKYESLDEFGQSYFRRQSTKKLARRRNSTSSKSHIRATGFPCADC